MSAFWDIVATSVQDNLTHDDWCDLVGWQLSKAELRRHGFWCCCRHSEAISAIRMGPLA